MRNAKALAWYSLYTSVFLVVIFSILFLTQLEALQKMEGFSQVVRYIVINLAVYFLTIFFDLMVVCCVKVSNVRCMNYAQFLMFPVNIVMAGWGLQALMGSGFEDFTKKQLEFQTVNTFLKLMIFLRVLLSFVWSFLLFYYCGFYVYHWTEPDIVTGVQLIQVKEEQACPICLSQMEEGS